MDSLMIGWTSIDDEAVGLQLAKELVEEKLAACVQLDGPLRSVYQWKGKVECDSEYRLMIKFTAHNAAEIEQWLKDKHPYETPQWYAVTVKSVAPEYQSWIDSVSR